MKKNIEDIYPLSPMQQGMLFHTLISPHSQIYMTQIGCLLEGKLNVAEFERAWQQVIDRHPILRTGFIWEKRAEPLQIVFNDVELRWIHEDWQDFPEESREARLNAFMVANQSYGFDLKKPPLLRPALIHIAEDKHYMILCHHHILMDGWTLPMILAEVFACYTANCQRTQPQLPARRPYGDYIDWLKKQDLQKAEQFWRQQLAGFVAPTTIGLETMPPGGTEQYRDVGIMLSAEMTRAFQQLAREHKLTMSILIQGAWSLLLHHYSGEQDIVFGLATSGRQAHLEDVESMIGLFVNTLPQRVHIQPDMPLVVWLRELQENLGVLLEYEYSPLVQVQGWSQVPRGVALFDSLLIFDNYPVNDFVQEQADTLRIVFLQSVEHTNYPLTLRTRPGAETFISLSYSMAHFRAAVIDQMLEHLFTTLTAFIEQPQQRLGELSILSERERALQLVEWNATTVPYSADSTLCQLFEGQVRRTPDAVAVVFGEECLTYRELNHRANQLAHYLKQRGVFVESLVGIYIERSLDMLISVLGILKSGAAYIPLDPTYPTERLEFISADAGLSLLLTQQSLLETPLVAYQSAVLCIEKEWTEIQSCVDTDPDLGLSSQHLAYVIYTSGSTGKPKGVQIAHTAVVNFLQSMQKQVSPTASDTLLAVTSLSFDIAGLELFLPLISGARLVIANQEETLDGQQLARALQKASATIMQATPATWRMLLTAGWQGQMGLKILCGGEAFPPDLAQALRSCSEFVLNLYGPTESTIWSTSYLLDAASEMVPIGRPLDNTEVYILNASLQPVPIGIRGDLYIGGKGLSYGYLHRPHLTAERFIPHPFAQTASERLYKTGDIARYRPDGVIEFLGRSDHQIKLRGFRIELGEIESVLAGYVPVQQSVVFLREESPTEKRLVCYIKSAATPLPSVNELRDYLRERLPGYMIPAAFVFLDKFPLTANGKIDYRALPAPDSQRPLLQEAFISARTSEEQMLLQIWQEVLHLDHIGVNDNFFDLGGHSILMMQLYTKVREQFQKEIPLVDMFKYPTIVSLASYLAAGGETEDEGKVTSEQADARAQQRTQSLIRQKQFREQQHNKRREKRGLTID